jgi:quercetin dioxygenase-like cupin family protein
MSERHDDMPQQQIHEALLNSIEPAELPADRSEAIKQRLMQRVGASAAAQPPDANGLVTIRAGEGVWQPVMPKVSMKVLLCEGNSLTYLLRLEPGARIPPHDHPQTEECIVLEGEARIGDVVVHAGDYHAAPAGRPHGMLASDHGALLFLRGEVPSAKHVHWASADTYAALISGALQKLLDRRT